MRTLLQATVPAEDVAISHGELGDSNVFLNVADDLWFINVGHGGMADRWLDIAFVHREIRDLQLTAIGMEPPSSGTGKHLTGFDWHFGQSRQLVTRDRFIRPNAGGVE